MKRVLVSIISIQGVLSAFALGALAFFYASQSFKCTDNPAGEGCGGRAKAKSYEIPSPEKADDRIATYTLWLAVFSGALVIVSAVQMRALIKTDKTASRTADAARDTAKATGDSVTLASNNAERQLRAYVHIHKAVRLSPHHPAPNFALEIKNYGHTPARKGRYWFVTRIAEYSARIGFEKPTDVEIGRFESAPNAVMSFPGINVPPDQLSLTGEQMAAFQEGKIALFVFCELCYLDVFDKDRTTRFLFRYGNDGITTGRLATCEDGNDST
jgi:hypothetical protein